jgi:hypothetical protein
VSARDIRILTDSLGYVLSQASGFLLGRIPRESHRALSQIRAFHLRATQSVLRRLAERGSRRDQDVVSFRCDTGARAGSYH